MEVEEGFMESFKSRLYEKGIDNNSEDMGVALQGTINVLEALIQSLQENSPTAVEHMQDAHETKSLLEGIIEKL